MRRVAHHLKSLIVVGFVAVLAACTTTGKPSGFLTSYDNFRPGFEGGVEQIWSHPDFTSEASFRVKMGNYTKVMIDPIWVSFANKEAYDGVDPKELQKLVNGFETELMKAITGAYPVVKQPGPNVLRLSIALTGVETPSRLLATTSTILPIGLGISSVSKLVTGEHTNVGSASMEIVAADSLSGETLFAATDRRAGDKGFKHIKDPTITAKESFAWWAKRLRKTLDRMHN